MTPNNASNFLVTQRQAPRSLHPPFHYQLIMYVNPYVDHDRQGRYKNDKPLERWFREFRDRLILAKFSTSHHIV